MEARLVGERGLPFHPLAARPLVGRGLLDRVRALVTALTSTLAARRLVRGLGVAVVVGTGGYASAPAVLGAALARVPVLLVEPNAAPGVANRWLSRWAAGAAVAFPAAGERLACPVTVTGVPVRAAFAAQPPPAGPPALLVAGGSQGAEQLNRLVPEALGLLARRGDTPATGPVEVTHQAGAGKVEATVARYATAGLAADGGGPATGRAASGFAVRVVPFLADMAAAVGAAHLVVSRAGAITLAELCAAGRPSVLVPLTLAGGHQLDNARALEAAGAAVVLPAAGLGADRLAAALGGLLADPGRLAALGVAARSLGRPGAAAAIADRVASLAGGTA
jgi:UDP-N-acetylglucosamine--N-acetylmuramyl-(pentapeptide) pyrophosphoryl-undecaprenol N-acetylglucosamine transferase